VGRLVELWKIEDTTNEVVYLYGPTREQSGHLTINKNTGEVTGTSVPELSENDSWLLYGMLAKAKAIKLYAAGVYPDETSMVT
jgi:hypothetical protein